MSRYEWPGGKRFAFSIVDDTDRSFVHNVQPVYQLLQDCGFRTTKTVWVYPPRNHFDGGSLLDADYLSFVQSLAAHGFEIALHGVGSGSFQRQEILEGLEIFKELLGTYPKLQVNHAGNPDNLYWNSTRFVFPVSLIYDMATRWKARKYVGHISGSRHFWGDVARKHILYCRNLTFRGTDTSIYDPRMPYVMPGREYGSRMWFSSSDGHTVAEFNRLLRPENIDRLEKNGGFCLVYTHFASGFVDAEGNVNPLFRERLMALADRPGWFVPASEILDHLVERMGGERSTDYWYQLRLNLLWAVDRVLKKLETKRLRRGENEKNEASGH